MIDGTSLLSPSAPEQFDVVVCAIEQQDAIRFCKLLALRGRRTLLLIEADSAQNVSQYRNAANVVVACTDLCSTDAICAALEPYRGRLAGVLNVEDEVWPAVFGAFERLVGRPPAIRASANARIKPRMRQLTKDIAPVAWALVRRGEDLSNAAQRLACDIGLPQVIKPIWGQGSKFVEIVADASAIQPALDRIFAQLAADPMSCDYNDGDDLWCPADTVLVEAFLPGSEFSLEAVVVDGQFCPIVIQEKHITEWRDGFRFETCNLVPSPFLEPKGKAAIHRLGQEVAACLGLNDCLLHIEIAWDGNCARLIEINPRMGGGAVRQTLEALLDVTVNDWPVRLYLNEPLPEFSVVHEGYMVGVFFSVDRPGVYCGVSGRDCLRGWPEFAFEVEYYRSGQTIPAVEDVHGARHKQLYVYDAFFFDDNPSGIATLVDRVRKTAKIELAKSDMCDQ